MAEHRSIWIGKDEHRGVLAHRGRTSRRRRTGGSRRSPPPSGRAHSTLARRRAVAFIEDRDTSDMWLLDLERRARRSGSRPAATPPPFWEDAAPRSRPTARRSPTRRGAGVARHRSPAARRGELSRARRPCGSTTTGWSSRVDRERRRPRSPSWPSTTRGRAGSPGHGDLDPHGDEGAPRCRRTARAVAYTSTPRATSTAPSIHVADVADRRGARADRHAGHARPRPGVVAGRPHARLRVECTGWYEVHSSAATARGDAPAHDRRRRLLRAALAPRRRPPPRRARPPRPPTSSSSTPRPARSTSLAPGGTWCAAALARRRARRGGATRTTRRRRELRLVVAGAASRTFLAPTPAAVARRRMSSPSTCCYRVARRHRGPRLALPPARAPRPNSPAPAIVYPHGGPTVALRRRVGRPRPVLRRQGLRLVLDQLPRQHDVRPRLRAGEPRRLGRRRHAGLPRRPDHLARSTGSTASRLGIFGASYGSYLALLSVDDDPSTASAARSAKYGDCDILTSWAQGDLVGRLDLERMMGRPPGAPDAYARRLADPPHRAARGADPRRPRRAGRAGAPEAVGRARRPALRRLGKTFEYVTYPTEGHGFLRAGPLLDFYRRLERFFDWYLRCSRRGGRYGPKTTRVGLARRSPPAVAVICARRGRRGPAQGAGRRGDADVGLLQDLSSPNAGLLVADYECGTCSTPRSPTRRPTTSPRSPAWPSRGRAPRTV